MRNRLAVIVCAGLLLATGVAFGQAARSAPATPAAAQAAPATQAAAPAANLAFDVATVKASAPLDMAKLQSEMAAGRMPRFGAHVDASRAEYNFMTLRELIVTAYKLKDYQVSGPDWMATLHFDIVATLPEGSTSKDAPQMLQALLQDRFKLKVHRETADHPVLALVVAKGGPKLKESPTAPAPIDPDAPLKPGEMKVDGPDGPIRVTVNMKDGSSTVNMGAKGVVTQRMNTQTQTLHLESTMTTMEGFADMLTNVMKMGGSGSRAVVDQTGLKGNYQIALDIPLAELMAIARSQMAAAGVNPGPMAKTGSPTAEASDPGGGTTIYKSVEELGLKLEPRKAPMEQLVVDSVEKTPTEN